MFFEKNFENFFLKTNFVRQNFFEKKISKKLISVTLRMSYCGSFVLVACLSWPTSCNQLPQTSCRMGEVTKGYPQN